jgi:hypothetical protein
MKHTGTLTLVLSLMSAIFLNFPVHAQYQVAGTVLNEAGEPLAAANILLLSRADSSLIKGLLSREDGGFEFDNVPEGAFLLRYAMIGYAPFDSEFFELDAAHPRIVFDPLRMTEASTLLESVTVTAKRPFLEQKIDRMVVNVANSITQAGGTALQVLQRSPGVQVNPLTKTISLVGKQGVVVMINGKISRLPPEAVVDMLSGMSADQIDRIELIHTPPANFDAEGNAGIINIVLKNAGDEGLNGGYSANAGHGRGPKYGAGAYLNFRRNNANWYASYEYNFNLNPQVFTNYRGVMQNNTFLETDTYSDRPHTPTTTQNGRIGADFQLSKKTVLGLLGTFLDRDWYMEAENRVTYSTNGAVTGRLRMPNEETNHARSLGGNINLSHQVSARQSLNFDADFIGYLIRNPSRYTVQFLHPDFTEAETYQLRIEKETPIQVAVGKADYSLQVGKNGKLETGAKYTVMRFDNDVRVDSLADQQYEWTVLKPFTSKFHLDESVAGAYATYSTKIGPKTDLKAGFRYEYTQTNLGSEEQPDIVDRKYGSWFPSLFLTRQITETQSLNLSYSRRINRPQIRWLAPWLIFSDPTTLEGGNPAIQPSFSDAFRLDYGFKTWRTGLSFNMEEAPTRFVPKVDPVTNRQVNSVQNLGNEKVISAYVYVPLKPAKWWEMGNNVYANAVEINFETEGQKIRLNTLTYGFNSTNTFKLPKNFTLEVSGNFDSPGFWGIAYWRATGSANIGIEKNFGEKWGKLRLNATDLFLSTNWYGTTDQPDINLLVRQSYQMAERTFMVSWTNTFGNRKIKSARERQTGAAEELRRL